MIPNIDFRVSVVHWTIIPMPIDPQTIQLAAARLIFGARAHAFRDVSWIAFLIVGTVSAQVPDFATVHGFLETHCFDCHDAETQKGKFRMDQLTASLESSSAVNEWSRIVTRLEAGEMPPPKRDRPPQADTQKLLTWGKTALAAEAKVGQGNERTRMRRLNRIEYENTVQDLLHVDVALQAMLPVDDRVEGFDTAAAALSVSPVHIQRYMDAAEAALQAAMMRGAKPTVVTKRFSYDHAKESIFLNQGRQGGMIARRDGEVQFYIESGVDHPAILQQLASFTREHAGRYRVRVAARTLDAKGELVTFVVYHSSKKQRAGFEVLGWFDAPADTPGVFEMETTFLRYESITIRPYRLNDMRRQRGLSQYPPEDSSAPVGVALGVMYVEVEGPLVEAWPPVGHRLLFGDVPMEPFKSLPDDVVTPGYMQQLRNSEKLTPSSVQPEADAKQLLQSFLPRAFRRPVSDDDLAPYLGIVREHLKRAECFEAAMLAAYRAALCSPEFLFLVEAPGPLDDHALASRLSYFLWRTAPDDALRSVADRGELHQPEVLKRETERLLASPRAQAFISDFLDQWLHLRDINATQPDKLVFPEFYVEEGGKNFKEDGLLIESMVNETRLFFADLLKNDTSLLQLIDSDWTYLNQRLASFYHLPPVAGSVMRRVSLPPDSQRGGVITQGSVLKVTANGTRTSPVVRGVWVLENILGRKPLPSPPDAGSIDPDTRGSTTIREQLMKHQSNESCASCHRQIDPPGFALESFDPAGQWREFYRTREGADEIKTKRKQPKASTSQPLKGRDVLGPATFLLGKPVDASGSMLTGEKFDGPQQFKKLLLREPHIITRCLAGKLVTFATGKATDAGDLLVLDAIAADAAAHRHGLRSLMHAVVQSDLFRCK